ncbi:MAG: hypothetical protein R3C26_22270 [Calditrichia bacterium]
MPDRIEISDAGRLVVRNIAMEFDGISKKIANAKNQFIPARFDLTFEGENPFR